MSARPGQRGEVAIVGAGPNGLAAAVVLARAGLHVRIYEAAQTPGGGARTAELIEPGTRHDVCSAVHPAAFASTFFRRFELDRRVRFEIPEISYAQGRVDDPALIAWRDLDRTAEELGTAGARWRRMFAPLVERADALNEITSGVPIRAVTRPAAALRFGLRALGQWQPVSPARPLGGAAADLLSGVAAHAARPLDGLSVPLTALTLATHAHAVGWPIPVGGSGTIVEALTDDLTAHGATIETGRRVRSLAELGDPDVVMFDTSLADLVTIGGDQVPVCYRRQVRRFRPGAGVGKADFVLSAPVPWADPRLGRAATVHLGGSWADVARAERIVARGGIPARPVIIASEPTRFDPSRTRPGRHVLWAYTHMPTGAEVDPTELIVAEVERYAPGFRDVIVQAASRSPVELAAYNPNYRGGDIYAGALTTRQTLFRPVPTTDPWRVTDRLYLCSQAAAPGPGVHGMGGYRAALDVLRRVYRLGEPALGPAEDQSTTP